MHLKRNIGLMALSLGLVAAGPAAAQPGRASRTRRQCRPRRRCLGAGCSRALVTLTPVHEFGHVLGLEQHTRRRARMNPSFDDSGPPDQCRERLLRYWLAHSLTAYDLRGLRAIYG